MARGVGTVAADVYCLGPWGRTQTNVYLVRSGQRATLIDAGWASDAPRIEQAMRTVLGPSVRPEGIVLTHCHPDHAGAAGQLARRWNCPVWMHPLELPIATGDFAAMQAWAGPLDRWVVLPVMRAMGARRRHAVLARDSLADVARAFPPGDEVPGLADWRHVPTPGHTPGHVSLLRPRDGVVVTGDALVTLQVNSVTGLVLQRRGLSGPPWYTTWDRGTATASMTAIAELRPTTIAPGHGAVLTGAAATGALADLQRRPRPPAARQGPSA
jgi:glyoxylase-like metal-dependent hydrolase (beta-lactamase superfamily II)